MAVITAELDMLRVRLTRGERWAALRRTDLTVPWDQVRSVEAVADPFRLVRGLRAPGLAVPWRTKIGTWRGHGRKTFAVTRKGLPGLRIILRGSAFDQILLSVANPVPLQSQMTARLTPDPTGTPVERVVAFPAGDQSQATLAGTVLLPPAGRPVLAGAVLITGSGPLDRDANAPRAALGVGRGLAQSLAAAGIASLRYDKRGVGASGGSYLATGFAGNVDDARMAVGSLAAQPECDSVPIFVIGHSEGAMIATALAAGSGTAPASEPGIALAGAVLLAGPAKTGEETVVWQASQIAPSLPKPVTLIMRLLRTDPAKAQRKSLDRLKASTTDVIRMQGVRVNAKWYREFLAFDPKPALAAITVPVLAITGDKDLQVDPADLEVIAATVRGPVTTRRVPDLTHILRRDPAPPSTRGYRALLKQPVDAVVLSDISQWIESVAANPAAAAQAADG
jgi:pimeloyl-ACP methyl ester carboxylesterase